VRRLSQLIVGLLGLAALGSDVSAGEPHRSASAHSAETVRRKAVPRAVRRTGVCDTLLPLRVSFRFGTGSRPAAPPTLGRKGELYVGTADGIVHALHADGSYRWSYTLRGAVTGRALLDSHGQILVPTARSIYALRPNGTLAWAFNNPVELLGDLLRDGQGRIRFASTDGRLFEFDGRGALIRHLRGRRPWSALPVLLPDGSVAVGSASGLVLVSQGDAVARFELDGAVDQVLWCPGDRLCAVANGELELLGAGSAWRTPARRAAAHGAWLAVLADERTLSLHRGAAEKRMFTTTLPDAASAAPAIDAQGRVYVPLMSGALVVYSAAGKLAGCEQIGRAQLATPAIASDGTVLLAGRDGVIAAVSAE
jgi:outer membrane protein assembly factor BamB